MDGLEANSVATCVHSANPEPAIIENAGGRVFVYLAYLDDSETKARNEPWLVISAVMIPADSFLAWELMSAMTIEEVVPENRRDRFKEFHACEIFGGYNIFDGVDPDLRFNAVRSLLASLSVCGFKVAYGAVNLSNRDFSTEAAQDVAFRRCVIGAGEWISSRVLEELQMGKTGAEHTALFVMDEPGNGRLRRTLQSSFRSLRSRFRFSGQVGSSLPFVHDDMYFGDSKFSVGIQLADLCSYFIAKHLGGDPRTQEFYKMIEPQIISAVKE